MYLFLNFYTSLLSWFYEITENANLNLYKILKLNSLLGFAISNHSFWPTIFLLQMKWLSSQHPPGWHYFLRYLYKGITGVSSHTHFAWNPFRHKCDLTLTRFVTILRMKLNKLYNQSKKNYIPHTDWPILYGNTFCSVEQKLFSFTACIFLFLKGL